MILTYIYNKIIEENKEDFAIGLAFGLAFGLAIGLTAGLAAGLAAGLIDIIINSSFQEALFVLIIILVISEILYWLDKHKIEDFGRWENTLLKKAESLIETSLVVVNIRNVIVYFDDFIDFISTQGETINLILSIVGYGTIVVLMIVGYIWINSLKFKEKKQDKPKPKKPIQKE